MTEDKVVSEDKAVSEEKAVLMAYEKWRALALEAGFTETALMDLSKVELKEEVRSMCASDKCHGYNRNWVCPPACGTLDECKARLQKFHYGIILQTEGELEDSMDYEGMMDLEEEHKKHFREFLKKIRVEYPDMLPLGSGGCRICDKCTYPDAPCRFPLLTAPSMEAYGMVVSDVCKANGLKYYYGPNTLAYECCCCLI